MGCCSSHPSGEQSQQRPDQRDGASRELAAAPGNLVPPPAFRIDVPRQSARPAIERRDSSSNSVATSMAGGGDGSRTVALNETFNEPLRGHPWRTKSSKRPWTRARWLAQREEFFHTRVTNRPEVWSSLSTVVEMMDTGDYITAQSILDASEITLPTGDLVDGAYDRFGNLYQLPHFVVTAPDNMVPDDDPNGAPPKKRGGTTEASRSGGPAAVEGEEPKSPMQIMTAGAGEPAAGPMPTSPISEKGKAVAKPQDLLSVKARLSDRGGPGQDVTVDIGKNDNAKVLIEGVAEKAGVAPEKIKIAYMGRVMKPNKGFVAQGWQLGHVVNALVLP